MSSSRRLAVLQAGAILVFLVLALQLVRLQVLNPVIRPGSALGAQPRVALAEAPRGLITDRAGRLLVRNVAQFSLVIVPGNLPTEPIRQTKAIIDIAHATGVSVMELQATVEAGLHAVDPLAPVTVVPGLNTDQAIALRAAIAGLPGVEVRATAGRRYEGGALFAHILGHVASMNPAEVASYLEKGYPLNATVGRDGVEFVYEPELRGDPSRRLVLSTPTSRELATLGDVPAKPGATVVLSVDADFQQVVETALKRGIANGLKEPGQGSAPLAAGAAVVLDVRTGEVIAMVSSPSYDANLFGGEADPRAMAKVFADPARPLVDRTYMEAHAPGSIFKPLVAAAALQEGVATPDTIITSYGAIYVQDVYNPSVTYTFGDWQVNGTMNLYQGLARSSDVYFYYLAGGYSQGGREIFRGLGPDKIAQYARAAGLGSPTGLDLPGETDGLVPDPAWKLRAVGDQWYLGDTYTYGIGQGYVTTTPVQMAVLAASIANGGEVLIPRVVRGFDRNGQLELAERRVRGTLPVTPERLKIVRDGMRAAAAAGGTANTGQPPGVIIGGKTGTAEFGNKNAYGVYPTHAWYIGFAPYDKPEIAIAIYLEHGVGAIDAGPVAQEILRGYFGTHRPANVEGPPAR